ncbi:hypothetical protein E9529_03200 [Blastococcus sp. KM273128]|uniref:hypothetical protein n=1 Tax=Blastococcus sp. KM273128 TaxID=2570314 RepID=UPI001F3A6936|nr:hypothetical protein [Blastococcus sp. KM273128]MCF6743294.1 hypothetical protein [Blastococcus sp. KM273128]
MTDRRGGTPQPVQGDRDSLVGPAVDTAEQLLDEHGEFFPCSSTLTADGEIGFAHGDPGLGERPPSQAVPELLHAGAVAERDPIRAVAFVADVRHEGSDAVRVELEHRDGGPALAVPAPHSLRGIIRKRARFADLHLAEGTPRTWH